MSEEKRYKKIVKMAKRVKEMNSLNEGWEYPVEPDSEATRAFLYYLENDGVLEGDGYILNGDIWLDIIGKTIDRMFHKKAKRREFIHTLLIDVEEIYDDMMAVRRDLINMDSNNMDNHLHDRKLMEWLPQMTRRDMTYISEYLMYNAIRDYNGDPETAHLVRSYINDPLYEAFSPSSYSSYGHSNRGRSGPVNSIMSPESMNIDDLDVPPTSELDDPNTLARVNMFVHQADGVSGDPWRIVKNIQYKLHLVGLNFKIPGTPDLPQEQTVFEFDVIKHGGDYGPMPDGTWKDDKGFEKGFIIRIEMTPVDHGKWELYVEIVKDSESGTDNDHTTEYSDSYS